MSVYPELDHVVFAGPTLESAIAAVEAQTGVRAQISGRHATGTANALIAFTIDGQRVPHYLEIIGPDAERGFHQKDVASFGIDRLDTDAVVAYASKAPEIAAAVEAGRAAGVDVGDGAPGSRTTPDGSILSWQVTPPLNAQQGAIVPFLIDWGTTPHPAFSDLPTLEIVSFTIGHPDPTAVRQWLAALGVTADVVQSDSPSVLVEVAGANGTVTLGG